MTRTIMASSTPTRGTTGDSPSTGTGSTSKPSTPTTTTTATMSPHAMFENRFRLARRLLPTLHKVIGVSHSRSDVVISNMAAFDKHFKMSLASSTVLVVMNVMENQAKASGISASSLFLAQAIPASVLAYNAVLLVKEAAVGVANRNLLDDTVTVLKQGMTLYQQILEDCATDQDIDKWLQTATPLVTNALWTSGVRSIVTAADAKVFRGPWEKAFPGTSNVLEGIVLVNS